MLTKSYGFCVDGQNHFRTAPLQILGMVPKWLWGYISVKLWHNDNKLCVCHCHHTQNTPHLFHNGATCWSKVISHSIILLIVLCDFSAIWTTIILKWLQLLIAAVGLMLASVVLGPVIAACSYIFDCYHELLQTVTKFLISRCIAIYSKES